MKNSMAVDWLLRFLKGSLVGLGAILPGVSGGALAAIFGLYERLIKFIANITKDFKKNFMYFLPVGIGGVVGIFFLSFVLSYLLETAEAEIKWFFIGCIAGVIPALFRQAGKNGRKPRHLMLALMTAAGMGAFLYFMQDANFAELPQNLFTWFIAGGIIGLGVIVPGMSPSNFLMYFGMYKSMTDGIKGLDFSVIIPIGLGVIVVVLALSKLFDFIFRKAYAVMFHFIFGVVIASTLMIVPLDYNYRSFGTLVCAGLCGLGVLLGRFMSKLEDKYKND